MKEDVIYTYPFNWKKKCKKMYFIPNAHYKSDDDYEDIKRMAIGEVRKIKPGYLIRANSFDEAYKLINEWIKKQ